MSGPRDCSFDSDLYISDYADFSRLFIIQTLLGYRDRSCRLEENLEDLVVLLTRAATICFLTENLLAII